MSIQKENNGTYTLRYVKKDYLTNKITRTKKRGFKTSREAKEYEKLISGRTSSVGFYTLFDEYQKTIEQEIDTYKGKVSLINKYLPELLTIQYSNLTKPFLLGLRTKISKLNLSTKTKNKLVEIIISTCRYANNIYDLPDNSKIIKRFKVVKNYEMEVWTPQEYYQFETALKGSYDDCIPFFRALYMTGMRKGEARALLVDDLNINDGYISITKSMRKYKSSLKAPKTPSGNRKIKLDKNTLELLKPLKRHEKWLFGDFKPISRDRIDRAFKLGIEKSGVKKIRIHDLRHSHATYLINNGANIVAVSKRLGHSSINMTLSTYAHLLADTENKLVDILNCVQNVSTQSTKCDK